MSQRDIPEIERLEFDDRLILPVRTISIPVRTIPIPVISIPADDPNSQKSTSAKELIYYGLFNNGGLC